MSKAILLIDDDPDEAEFFRDVLADIDPSISYQHCLSGITAISKIADREIIPDLIFLDINMPEMNGWECLRELKSLPAGRGIPVYMYSTSKRENDRIAARRMGAVELVTKAYDYRKFKDSIADILLGGAKYLSAGNQARLSSLTRFIALLLFGLSSPTQRSKSFAFFCTPNGRV
jgi:CheY-like chemotaxis protein